MIFAFVIFCLQTNSYKFLTQRFLYLPVSCIIGHYIEMFPFVSNFSWDLLGRRVERNLNFQKTGCSIFCISRFNDRCLRAPALPNKLLSLKGFPLDRMVDTVCYVTSIAIFSLFGYRVRPTATYYMKTFDVKLPIRLFDRSGVRFKCSLFWFI